MCFSPESAKGRCRLPLEEGLRQGAQLFGEDKVEYHE